MSWYVHAAVTALLVYMLKVYGEGDLSILRQMDGPYGAGHREIKTPKDKLEIAIYYPIDKEIYNRDIVDDSKKPFMMYNLPDREERLEAISEAYRGLIAWFTNDMGKGIKGEP
jgi:hypothetical protein